MPSLLVFEACSFLEIVLQPIPSCYVLSLAVLLEEGEIYAEICSQHNHASYTWNLSIAVGLFFALLEVQGLSKVTHKSYFLSSAFENFPVSSPSKHPWASLLTFLAHGHYAEKKAWCFVYFVFLFHTKIWGDWLRVCVTLLCELLKKKKAKPKTQSPSTSWPLSTMKSLCHLNHWKFHMTCFAWLESWEKDGAGLVGYTLRSALGRHRWQVDVEMLGTRIDWEERLVGIVRGAHQASCLSFSFYFF